MGDNIDIRFVKSEDKNFWSTLDKHLSDAEFCKKVRDKQGYIITAGDAPVGLLRYNLFWDNTPFCTLLYIAERYRNRGCGKLLMTHWEQDMRALGYDWVLVSTRSDETAQNFYRAIGYADCGVLSAPNQPQELFLSKRLV